MLRKSSRDQPNSPGIDAEDRLERIRRMGTPNLWIGVRDDIFHIDWLEEWREEWGLEDDTNDPLGKDRKDDKPKP